MATGDALPPQGRRPPAMMWWVGGLIVAVLAMGVRGQDGGVSDPDKCQYTSHDLTAGVSLSIVCTIAAMGIIYCCYEYCLKGICSSTGTSQPHTTTREVQATTGYL